MQAESREEAFKKASLVLLLVSANFAASSLCQEQMQQALELQRQGEVRVIPILLHAVDWKEASFAHLQVLPANEKPITSWSNQEEALTEVAVGLRRVIQDDSISTVKTPRTGLP